MTNTQKLVLVPGLVVIVLIGGALIGYAQFSNADTNGAPRMGMMGMHVRGDGVHGAITAIDGSTITVQGGNGTTYTVDGSDAAVRKFVEGEGGEDIALSDLKVGDEIGVRGEVDGTSIDATHIMNGHPHKGMWGGHRDGHGVVGKVTTVDGATITVESPDGTRYTVDAKDAPVSRVVTGTLDDIDVGDRIGVRGTVDGATVDAAHIMDDLKELDINE
jgi:preprotein translocase subunit YajC